MEVNYKLIDELIEMFENIPTLHEQYTWQGRITTDTPVPEEEKYTCGTTLCIAGAAAVKYFDLPIVNEEFTIAGETRYDVGYALPEGRDWEELGQEALGLDDRLAFTLFRDTVNEEAMAALYDLRDHVPQDVVREKIYAGDYEA